MGEENATTGNELGAYFNADDSFIRVLAHSLKCKDITVCSCPQGYFMHKNDDEARRCGRRERARIARQQAAARVFDKYEKQPPDEGGH